MAKKVTMKQLQARVECQEQGHEWGYAKEQDGYGGWSIFECSRCKKRVSIHDHQSKGVAVLECGIAICKDWLKENVK